MDRKFISFLALGTSFFSDDCSDKNTDEVWKKHYSLWYWKISKKYFWRVLFQEWWHYEERNIGDRYKKAVIFSFFNINKTNSNSQDMLVAANE